MALPFTACSRKFGKRSRIRQFLLHTRGLARYNLVGEYGGCFYSPDYNCLTPWRKLTTYKTEKQDQQSINMSKHTKQNLGKIITLSTLAALLLTGCATNVGMQGTTTQAIPFTPQNSGSGSSCPGVWTGYARMTNTSDGTIWVKPPTNAIRGTLTDVSIGASNYVSVACVTRQSNQMKWCDTNSVTFPVTNTAKYSMYIYVKSPLPPPTNSQPIGLQITWQTN